MLFLGDCLWAWQPEERFVPATLKIPVLELPLFSQVATFGSFTKQAINVMLTSVSTGVVYFLVVLLPGASAISNLDTLIGVRFRECA